MANEVFFDTSGFFTVMKERKIAAALTTDAYFRKARFTAVLL
jgi:hypothetical protein